MKKTVCYLALSASVLAASGGSALAQRPGNDVGTGQSLPLSNNASNGTPGNTLSEIAPRLPSPPVPAGSPPAAYLQAAKEAISEGRTGEAQEALEQAETRALDRSVAYNAGNQPIRTPLIETIMGARRAIAQGDNQRAIRLINQALRMPGAVVAPQ